MKPHHLCLYEVGEDPVYFWLSWAVQPGLQQLGKGRWSESGAGVHLHENGSSA
jgi:hypothetical protein